MFSEGGAWVYVVLTLGLMGFLGALGVAVVFIRSLKHPTGRGVLLGAGGALIFYATLVLLVGSLGYNSGMATASEAVGATSGPNAAASVDRAEQVARYPVTLAFILVPAPFLVGLLTVVRTAWPVE